MGRRHAQGARRRPRPSPPRPPSMCFTTIDILAVGLEAVKVAAASTREHHCDDDHPSDCGQHPVGSPLAKPAAARWHLHISAATGWPPGRPRTGRRPRTGAPGRSRANARGAAQQRGWDYNTFFLETQEVAGRGLPTAPSGGFLTNKRFHSEQTELSWAANRGERSTSGAKSARWRKPVAQKYGCDRVRCSPVQLRHTEQSSRALHCIVGRRGRDESYGCIPLSRAPGTITSLAPRRPARRPSQTRASAATAASVRSPPAPSSWALIAGCGPRRCRRCGGRVG
jgi:hypothetical protein